MVRDDVLIVGAGPTGMVLALWLKKMGINIRVLDKASGPGTTSRAMLVQARTLELYRQLDLANAVLAGGRQVNAINYWVGGERKAHIDFGPIGEGLTPYPYLEVFPQDLHENLLVERLAQAGVSIQRNTEVLDYTDHGTHISARAVDASGNRSVYEAAWIVGCDGAHSIVRKGIAAGFPGGTYQKLFYVADVEASGPAVDGDANLDLEGSDLLLLFNYGNDGRVRLIGTIDSDATADPENLTFADVSSVAINKLHLDIRTVHWFSTYHVHHRVADHFTSGRAFIAGDAGHIHSPAGGQGMNTGIGDAINLAWKLAAVVRGEASETLLASYDAERLGFAHQLVETTDRGFTLATAEGHLASLIRTRIAPVLLPLAIHLNAGQFIFRTVSQTLIHYRHSPLSEGEAGKIHGGDRLPWVRVNGRDNYDALPLCWNLHVYGDAKPALSAWCAAHNLPLAVFPWAQACEAAGLARNAAYLIRPDTYVALALPDADPASIENFLTARSLHPAKVAQS